MDWHKYNKEVKELTSKKLNLASLLQRIPANDSKRAEICIEIGKIRNQLSVLRDSAEYDRFKLFLVAVKGYLTADEYREAWERVDKMIEANYQYDEK